MNSKLVELEAQLDRERQETARLRGLLQIRETGDTIIPGSDDEPTGPIHPDPIAEVFVAIDQLRDAVAAQCERLDRIEKSIADMANWRPKWVDEVLAVTERVIVVEEWQRRHDAREALGGQ